HLGDCAVDLFDAGRLLATRGGYLADDVGYLLHGGDNFLQRATRLVHQLCALGNTADAFLDQGLDFLRCNGAATGQVPNLVGDDGKAAPLISCTRGFDRGIEGQQVRLEGDFVDDTDDVGDLGGC